MAASSFSLNLQQYTDSTYDAELKTYFEKKISEGKHYFTAMCAVERKLIHRIWAIWRRGTPFEKR